MSFEQLRELMVPYVNEKVIHEIDTRHITDDIDLFIPTTERQRMREGVDILFKLEARRMERDIERHGLDKVIGTECQYNYSILAKYENEQDIKCREKPTKIIGGLKPNGQPANMSLCEYHFEKSSRWLDKQPDMI